MKKSNTPLIKNALQGNESLEKTNNSIDKIIQEKRPRCYVLFDFAKLNIEQIELVTSRLRKAYSSMLIISASSTPSFFDKNIAYDFRVCFIEPTNTGVSVIYRGVISKLPLNLLQLTKNELTLKHKVK